MDTHTHIGKLTYRTLNNHLDAALTYAGHPSMKKTVNSLGHGLFTPAECMASMMFTKCLLPRQVGKTSWLVDTLSSRPDVVAIVRNAKMLTVLSERLKEKGVTTGNAYKWSDIKRLLAGKDSDLRERFSNIKAIVIDDSEYVPPRWRATQTHLFEWLHGNKIIPIIGL